MTRKQNVVDYNVSKELNQGRIPRNCETVINAAVKKKGSGGEKGEIKHCKELRRSRLET